MVAPQTRPTLGAAFIGRDPLRPTPELLVLALVLLGVSGIAGTAMWQKLPPRLDPWAVLDVREAPAPVVTRMKLARLQRERRMCDAALATAGLRVTRVAYVQGAKACPLTDAIHVAPENRVFGGGFHATCPLAVALAVFVRHTLQPAARRHLGAEIARIEHLGTYSCRPIRGYAGPSQKTARAASQKGSASKNGAAEATEAAALSEHASANAIDITGFVTRDGRRVRVATDWKRKTGVVPASDGAASDGATLSGARRAGVTGGFAPGSSGTPAAGVAAARPGEETTEAKFLREVRDGACEVFHGVLGPEFNAAHRSHFHLDMGRHKVCR
jgi:hypothetical protein